MKKEIIRGINAMINEPAEVKNSVGGTSAFREICDFAKRNRWYMDDEKAEEFERPIEDVVDMVFKRFSSEDIKEALSVFDEQDVIEKVEEAMDLEEENAFENRIIPPVSLIDSYERVDGGYDIHCSNGYNFRMGQDGYLYDIGYDQK